MRTEYEFRNGTIVKCEYLDGVLHIDEDIAFRTIANEQGEKERVIAIDLNTGLTTNKHINENSKVKPSLAKLNKLRVAQGLKKLTKKQWQENIAIGTNKQEKKTTNKKIKESPQEHSKMMTILENFSNIGADGVLKLGIGTKFTVIKTPEKRVYSEDYNPDYSGVYEYTKNGWTKDGKPISMEKAQYALTTLKKSLTSKGFTYTNRPRRAYDFMAEKINSFPTTNNWWRKVANNEIKGFNGSDDDYYKYGPDTYYSQMLRKISSELNDDFDTYSERASAGDMGWGEINNKIAERKQEYIQKLVQFSKDKGDYMILKGNYTNVEKEWANLIKINQYI